MSAPAFRPADALPLAARARSTSDELLEASKSHGGDRAALWAGDFVRSLVASGVRRAVVSPGSRSTPLAIAIAQEPKLTTHVIVDERSAAYVALGQGRATGMPSLLLCTSGTAAANYLPAIVEANWGRTPLIVVTADRSWEDVDTGAAQTIDQTKIYSGNVRHFAELGPPDDSELARAHVGRIAAQALRTALGPPSGPVHVNARFRKPLEPSGRPLERASASVSRVFAPREAPSAPAVLALRSAIAHARRGLIVAGPSGAHGDLAKFRSLVGHLARKTGFPVVAEATSQLRFGSLGADSPLRLGCLDCLARAWMGRSGPLSPDAAPPLPDLVLALGGSPVSSAWQELVVRHAIERWVVSPTWSDPTGTAAAVVLGDVTEILDRLLTAEEESVSDFFPDRETRMPRDRWSSELARFDGPHGSERVSNESMPLTEDAVARLVVESLAPESTLIVGNSRTVRSLDHAVLPNSRALRIVHQRGASGIDGFLSLAAGVRSASDGAVALLVGDLSALHDLGGLAALRRVGGPLPIVIVDNGGGRIFEDLPIARAVDRTVLETFFVTPEFVDFGAAAHAFGLPHSTVDSREELVHALARAFGEHHPHVLHVRVATTGGPT